MYIVLQIPRGNHKQLDLSDEANRHDETYVNLLSYSFDYGNKSDRQVKASAYSLTPCYTVISATSMSHDALWSS